MASTDRGTTNERKDEHWENAFLSTARSCESGEKLTFERDVHREKAERLMISTRAGIEIDAKEPHSSQIEIAMTSKLESDSKTRSRREEQR
jgi:hypothetical protein